MAIPSSTPSAIPRQVRRMSWGSPKVLELSGTGSARTTCILNIKRADRRSMLLRAANTYQHLRHNQRREPIHTSSRELTHAAVNFIDEFYRRLWRKRDIVSSGKRASQIRIPSVVRQSES